jgi:hypothetical protein
MRLHYFAGTASRDNFSGRITGYTKPFDAVTRYIWFDFFRISIDDRPTSAADALQYIRNYFDTATFNRSYDLLEFMGHYKPLKESGRVDLDAPPKFHRACNRVLERERAAFRFVSNILVPITNEGERRSVEEAIEQDNVYGASAHIRTAAEHYGARPDPNYRNSIKESISAVEAVVAHIAGKKPSGIYKPLEKLTEELGLPISLRDGFSKLYSYTSGENGIRHSMLERPNITQADARYMLISCSAFANYLIALNEKRNRSR